MMIYLLILIAVAIGMAMYGVLALLVVGLALAIPVGLLALIGYLIWQAAHLTWTPATIGVVVSLAVVVVFAFLYAGQCALQPAMVFRRSLSLVVLGQADDTLVTVPTGNVPPVLPQE
jgi:hypothetical protein